MVQSLKKVPLPFPHDIAVQRQKGEVGGGRQQPLFISVSAVSYTQYSQKERGQLGGVAVGSRLLAPGRQHLHGLKSPCPVSARSSSGLGLRV